MTTPLLCLLGFAAWIVILLIVIAVSRIRQVLRGQMAANAFPSGQPHGPDRYWRLNRAHLNATENLPVFAAVVLVGTLAGVQTASFSLLAQVTLAARVVQSVVHVSSNSIAAVNLRFAGMLVQLVCIFWMGIEILRIAA